MVAGYTMATGVPPFRVPVSDQTQVRWGPVASNYKVAPSSPTSAATVQPANSGLNYPCRLRPLRRQQEVPVTARLGPHEDEPVPVWVPSLDRRVRRPSSWRQPSPRPVGRLPPKGTRGDARGASRSSISFFSSPLAPGKWGRHGRRPPGSDASRGESYDANVDLAGLLTCQLAVTPSLTRTFVAPRSHAELA